MSNFNIQDIIDAMAGNVAIVDESGIILYVNKSWDEFSRANNGSANETSTGTDYFSIIHASAESGDEFAKKVEQGINDILSRKSDIFEIEYPCHSEHEFRWFIANIMEIPSTSPRQFLFTHKNVTSLVTREKRVVEAQRMQAIGQLTGGFAHDFNNLLSVIMGNLELTKKVIPQDSPSVSYLDRSIEAINRGSELVQSLLSFARNQRFNLESIQPNYFIDNTLKLIAPAINKNLEFEINIEPNLDNILVDAAMLTNAILNIVINATHAMEPGGKLTIDVSAKNLDDEIFFTSEDVASGSYLCIAITDTGCGISDESIEKVIEPFYTTKDIGKGSGLGLSMVYGFIKQSNGHFNIHSRVGYGTTIFLYLPFDNSNQNKD